MSKNPVLDVKVNVSPEEAALLPGLGEQVSSATDTVGQVLHSFTFNLMLLIYFTLCICLLEFSSFIDI